MNAFTKFLALAALAVSAAFASPATADTTDVSARGKQLAHVLDSFDVESKWIAGQHVNWRSGLPDDPSGTLPGRHTHCSAFVAAVAERLGVYILRPPEHEQVLLANAQNEWLASEGAATGWRPVRDPVEAQSLANRGLLVVASYHAPRDNKPGHISIIRPAARSLAEIEADGPMSAQAGRINSSAIPVRLGFADHTQAWRGEEIEYYAHEISRP